MKNQKLNRKIKEFRNLTPILIFAEVQSAKQKA